MSREEQIELMKECLQDAAEVLKPYKPNYAFHEKATLAAGFFGYRTRQRALVEALSSAKKESLPDEPDIPCDTPDKAADLEED